MSDTDFDYGGEVATTASKFKQPEVGVRNARLYALLRVGTFQESHDGKLKDAAPQAIAIFHMLGKQDKTDEGEPMFFSKTFPMKKGDKTFLHRKANGFISSFGGLSKHTGFGSMINGLFSLSLTGGKEENEDGTPKYVNFAGMSEIGADTLELLDAAPAFAALPNPIGFLTESQLTKEALEAIHPTREFAGIIMQTQEYKAGIHPSQAIIDEVYNSDKERYTITKKDKEDQAKDANKGQSASGASSLPATPEVLNTEVEY